MERYVASLVALQILEWRFERDLRLESWARAWQQIHPLIEYDWLKESSASQMTIKYGIQKNIRLKSTLKKISIKTTFLYGKLWGPCLLMNRRFKDHQPAKLNKVKEKLKLSNVFVCSKWKRREYLILEASLFVSVNSLREGEGALWRIFHCSLFLWLARTCAVGMRRWPFVQFCWQGAQYRCADKWFWHSLRQRGVNRVSSQRDVRAFVIFIHPEYRSILQQSYI